MKCPEIFDAIDHISEAALAGSACKLIEPPAVLFVVRGMILVHTLPVALSRVPLAINQDMKALRPREGLDAEYLAYMLGGASHELLARVEVAGHGTRRLKSESWQQLLVPVPAAAEQRRIVARVREALDRVNELANLAREAKQASNILVASLCTDTFAELRKQCPSTTIDHLVDNDPTAMRSGPFGSAMKHDEFVSNGHLVIGIANVQQNRFDPVRKWMISDHKYREMQRYTVKPGDVLVTVMGTIGRCCVVPDDIGVAITSKHVYRIRLPKDKVDPSYVTFALNYDRATIRQLFGVASGGVMPGLNSTKLRGLELPLPTLEQQHATVTSLTRAEQIVQEIEEGSKSRNTAALQTSILRKAFAGDL
jgi:type I restriction enzyme S subunit